MLSQVQDRTFSQEELLVIKHTFLELQWPDKISKHKLRRNKSESSMAYACIEVCGEDTLQCVKSKEVKECMTPTTCPSVNGDEDSDVLSEEGFEVHITSSSSSASSQEIASSDRWVDICDSASEGIDSFLQGEQKMEESGKKPKPWRRSGRARQREQRRRRMRTPSPAPYLYTAYA